MTLKLPLQTRCTLMDISVGGVKLLFEDQIPGSDLAPGSEVAGEIVCEAPHFHLEFTGKVVWNRLAAVVGENATMIGVSFPDYTDLPEGLMHLVDDFGQGD